MPLKFYLGLPGAGKTEYCINDISEAQKANAENLVFVVPEQFSLQMERELLRKSGIDSLFKVQVLSFKRLAYKIFQEVSGTGRSIIDDVGMNMMIRKAVAESAEKLSYYKSAASKKGFIDKLNGVFKEFYRNGVTVEKIIRSIENIEENKALKLKLYDIALVFEKLNQIKDENFISPDEILDILTRKIEKSDYIIGASVWIDGFHGFTKQEYDVIEKLMLLCKNVTISIIHDGKSFEDGEDSLFGESSVTYKRLLTIAGRNRIKTGHPVLIEKSNCAADLGSDIKNDELSIIREMLFRENIYRSELAAGRLQIHCADTEYEEIKYAAVKIRNLIIEEKYKYNDIAVVACGYEETCDTVGSVFESYGIPVFIDKKEDLTSHPLSVFILSSLEIITSSWSYDSIFRMIKTGLTGFTRDEADVLENFVLEHGIKGGKWFSAWNYSDELDKNEYFNTLRERTIAYIAPLSARLKRRAVYEAGFICEVIYEYLVISDIEERLEEWSEHLRASPFTEKNDQVFSKVISVLERLSDTLGGMRMTAAELKKVLEAGFQADSLGTIPHSLDRVIIADLNRSRLHHIKALFVVGAVEGRLPAKVLEDGILSSSDRETVSEIGLDIDKGGLSRLYENRFNFYASVSKPSDKLFISFFRGTEDGKAAYPSPYVTALMEMFPKISIGQISFEDIGIEMVVSRESAFRDIAGLISGPDCFSGEFTADLISCLRSDDKMRARIEKVLAQYSGKRDEERLSALSIRRIYGGKLKTSVSKLEKYGQCPFSYYAQYVLRAKERKILELNNLEIGNFFHGIIDKFSKELIGRRKEYSRYTEDEILSLSESCIDKSLSEESNYVLGSSEQYKYFAKRIKNIAKASIGAIFDHLKAGMFGIEFSEVVFSDDIPDIERQVGDIKVFDALFDRLSDGTKLIIEGKIDRIDLLTVGDMTYVKIIDYKTGNRDFSFSEFYYGLQLQLIVYLYVFLKKNEENKSGKLMSPAGALYFLVKNPVLKYDVSEYNNLLAEFKMSGGLVLKNHDVVEGFDSSMADGKKKSDIVPIIMTGKGEFRDQSFHKSLSKAVDAEEFRSIIEYSFEKAKEAAERVISGDISVSPFKLDKKNGCMYCVYKAVCKFDPLLENEKYRRLPNIKKEETIKRISAKK